MTDIITEPPRFLLDRAARRVVGIRHPNDTESLFAFSGDAGYDRTIVTAISVESYAALRAISASDGQYLLVLGRETAGDWGPPRWARWTEDDVSTEVALDEVTADEGDGGLYVAPTSDKTGASGAWVFEHRGELDLAWYGGFGVIGDTTDEYPAFAAAYRFAGRANSGVNRVYAKAGDYYVSGPVLLNHPGLVLAGDGPGSMWDTAAPTGHETRIIGTSTTGPVVWVRKEGCTVDGVWIDADSARAAAAQDSTYDDLNVGLRVEGDNVARSTGEGDVMATHLRRVYVKNQPNTGVMLVGKVYESILDMVYASTNNGDGIAFDDGTNTGRTVDDDDEIGTNFQASIVTMNACKTLLNEGHGFRLGDTSDNNYTLRVTMINCETSQNGATSGYLKGANAAQVFAHCDGLTYMGGSVGAIDKAAFCLMGCGGDLLNVRLPSAGASDLIYIEPQAARTTKGWRIINPNVRSWTAGYLVNITDTSVENVVIWIGSETQLTGTEIVTAPGHIDGLDVYYKGVHTKYFTERQHGAAPVRALRETDAAENAKVWRDIVSGGALERQIGNDAEDTWYKYVRVERTGNSVTRILFYNATDTLVATLDSTGLVIASGKDIYGQNGLKITPTKINNQAVTTTPVTILDASASGKLWEITGRHTGGATPNGFFRCLVGSGTATPVAGTTENMPGASAVYTVSVSGTNVQLAVASGSATTDIFIRELVVA